MNGALVRVIGRVHAGQGTIVEQYKKEDGSMVLESTGIFLNDEKKVNEIKGLFLNEEEVVVEECKVIIDAQDYALYEDYMLSNGAIPSVEDYNLAIDYYTNKRA